MRWSNYSVIVHLEEILGELKRIVTGIDTQIATFTFYRKSMIYECVIGKRRISEATVVCSQLSKIPDN